MKKIILIYLFLLPFSGFAQKINDNVRVEEVLDTLNYLKTFEVNKSKYIGKPFSVLLSDMKKIQPKTVWPLHGRYKTSIVGNRFKFADMDFSFDNVITLFVDWSESIPIDNFEYYTNRNGFYFTQEERTYLGSKIIKDIMVYR
ncbi:hypothetical protein [Algoriella sp.]|uniref:hypothetical protein n=1 Tax=Algoriella sp. TaxID=1872434 RepID=UPI002FC97087